MTLDIYAEEIIDRFKNPRNFGAIEKPDFEAEEFNPLCGDRIKLQIKNNNNNKLIVKFSGQGCAISQASTDILCDHVNTKSKNEIKDLQDSEMLKLIGISIAGARLKCALLGLWALRTALNNAEQSSADFVHRSSQNGRNRNL